jgi:hypothetical protein
MLKWVVVIVVLVLVTGLLRQALSCLRLGRLPGDVNFSFRGRPYYLPFTTTLLLSLVAWLILRSI